MPATITPNKTDQERKRRLEDHDNGSGRRPPTDKRTGGGGDNDNWNERSNSRRGPYERLHRYRMGIFFALASARMFFVSIASAFLVTQPAAPPPPLSRDPRPCAPLAGTLPSRQLGSRQILVDRVSWYWHAMGLLWLFL